MTKQLNQGATTVFRKRFLRGATAIVMSALFLLLPLRFAAAEAEDDGVNPVKRATKHPMPEQDADVRNKNFTEVALGYTCEIAMAEAQRCLHCADPKCAQGCPVNVHIPEFIAKVKNRSDLAFLEFFEFRNINIEHGSIHNIDSPSIY